MSVLKAIAGRVSTKWLARYLTRGGRALAVDCVNVAERDWSRAMEETRTAFGNDRARRVRDPRTGRERAVCRTYQHYVISLAPGERDLDGFRAMVGEWVRRNLADYQVAVVYHDDNRTRAEDGLPGLLHAHLVVNNTNVRTGGRITSEITRARYARMRGDLERLAREHGFSFLDDSVWDKRGVLARSAKAAPEPPREAKAAAAPREANPGARLGSECAGVFERVARRARRSPAEQAVYERLGRTWKEDIRTVLDRALDGALSEGEFLRRVRAAGVTVSAARDGDYVFGHPTERGHAARGCMFGDRYSRYGVRAVTRANALAGRDAGAFARAVKVGVKDSRYTTVDVARMLEAVRDSGATSLRELEESNLPGAARAAGVAREIGFFALQGASEEGPGTGAARVLMDAKCRAAARGAEGFRRAAEEGARLLREEGRGSRGASRGRGGPPPGRSPSRGRGR